MSRATPGLKRLGQRSLVETFAEGMAFTQRAVVDVWKPEASPYGKVNMEATRDVRWLNGQVDSAQRPHRELAISRMLRG